MAIFAISVLPPFLGSSRHFSIAATHRGAKPRHGVLAFSTSAPSFVLRASSDGFSSGRYDVDLFLEKEQDFAGPSSAPLTCCFCGHCGRRHLLGGLSWTCFSALPGEPSAAANNGDSPVLPPKERDAKLRASRPGWYKELYARVMDQGMKSYEAEVAGYKQKLFSQLKGQSSKILEVGVGTGPNLKYYANTAGVDVFGVDPNEQMEKYARAKALAAGVGTSSWTSENATASTVVASGIAGKHRGAKAPCPPSGR
ncbi:hypothetical protein Taro_013241 [Colocasia esculenta]|uniref:Methyltransferase domain-containing protein n=1 Tax=Colocasia esculenta TaxID=4460 RepID=A0A843UFP1_COLES|nr:hypothetical protein [Colocasia esculenta]